MFRSGRTYLNNETFPLRKRRILRVCIKILSIIAAVCLISLVAAIVLIVEQNASVPSMAAQKSADTKIATQFIKRTSRKIVNAKNAVTVSASEHELNSALQLIHTAYPAINGSTALADEGADAKLSVRISIFGKRFFINTKTHILPSANGILLAKSRIGSLPLPDAFANYIFRKTVEVLLGKQYGTSVLEGIERLSLRENKMTLHFDPPAGFHQGFAKAVQRVSSYSGQNIDFDSARVQHYLNFLQNASRQRGKKRISIAQVLTILMQEARHMTAKDGTDPGLENTSAIYALAILIEPGVFRHLVSDLQLNGHTKEARPRVTLRGKYDLAKHFVYSAALHILAEKGVSFSLGEAKEIMDSEHGGSGFSFADIAADRAGIRFTEIATSDSPSASVLQEFCAAGLEESHFFPPVKSLPDGLSQKEFDSRFSDVNSKAYQTVIQSIDQALASTALLNLNGKVREDSQ